MIRPVCPKCSKRVDRMQRSHGVVAVYPCNHWLTPGQAQTVADEYWRRTGAVR